MQQRIPTILIVLDGWGYNDNLSHNAIKNARTPQWDSWWDNCPHILLDASGGSVGLPNDQMGNSEVGHMHIGSGRTILQNYTYINNAIDNGEFDNNSVFLQAISNCKNTNKAIHIMGLLSDGGVHSHQQHLFAFLKLCAKKDFQNVFLHLFLDGRDTPPQSAKKYLYDLQEVICKYKVGKICSLSGRYFAMDRDKKWQRIEKVYNLLVNGQSEKHYKTAESALDEFYKNGIFDEFIPPTQIGENTSIEEGDAVFFINFRADRARQLTRAFIDDDFADFTRQKTFNSLFFISMTKYDENLKTKVAFQQPPINNTLGEIIANNNLKQLRIAETEKYAHVTFFLNGGSEIEFNLEDRALIPSPNVATYDIKPEMSADIITNTIVDAIDNNLYDVIICNFANADMVGHSGIFEATVKAIECLDRAMQTIGKKVLDKNGQMLITADHGNAELMFNDTTSQPHTAHTSMPVPLLYVGSKKREFKQITASLVDIAPTFLAMLDIKPPKEMTGKILWA